ncbi:MAG: leucine-rich repeat protein, partial [Candidatus Coproplasma sp.]
MSKNVIIDGETLDGVTSIKAKLAGEDGYVSFVDTSDATATASDISATKTAYVGGVKITGTNTGVKQNDLDGIIDGTLTSFTLPSGMVTIKQYRFYQFTSLNNANLGAVQTVETYAFYGCTNTECVVPDTITTVGQYAFYNFGRNKTGFEFNPISPCSIGAYGFYGARVTKLSGTFTSISSY